MPFAVFPPACIVVLCLAALIMALPDTLLLAVTKRESSGFVIAKVTTFRIPAPYGFILDKPCLASPRSLNLSHRFR